MDLKIDFFLTMFCFLITFSQNQTFINYISGALNNDFTSATCKTFHNSFKSFGFLNTVFLKETSFSFTCKKSMKYNLSQLPGPTPSTILIKFSRNITQDLVQIIEEFSGEREEMKLFGVENTKQTTNPKESGLSKRLALV